MLSHRWIIRKHGFGLFPARSLATPVGTFKNVLFVVCVRSSYGYDMRAIGFVSNMFSVASIHLQASLFRAFFAVAALAPSYRWQPCDAAARRGLGSPAGLRLRAACEILLAAWWQSRFARVPGFA